MNYLAMPEQWRAIPGLEGYYDASTHGRIRSVRRLIRTPHNGERWQGGQVLKPSPRTDKRWPSGAAGRLKVSISVNGQVTYYDVAVLVARTWLPAGGPGEQVLHGPAGLSHNDPGSIYYGTPARNAQDRERDGTALTGEKNGRAKLTWAIVDEIRRRHSTGERQQDLALEFGVSPGAVAHVIHGRKWVRSPEDLAITSPRGQAGASNAAAKLTWDDVTEIRRKHQAGSKQNALATEFGVTAPAISNIIRGKTWAK